ncbi:MAG: dihydrolipoamide acetyltransferase family protein [Bdellovibrionota bacterium]
MSHSTEVLMPLMGEGVNEATVIRWLKAPGEKVEKDEPLIEVSTDKVDTEIPAPASGYLIACFAEEGSAIEVYQTIAQISEDPKAQVITPSNKADREKPSNAGNAVPSSGGEALQVSSVGMLDRKAKRQSSDRSGGAYGASLQSPLPASFAGAVRTSPLVRKMAKEHGLDLRMVPGSGLHGRITRSDVEEYLQTGGQRIPRDYAMPNQVQEFDPTGPLFTVKTKNEDGKEFLDGVEVRREKMSKIRWLTAEHMLRSVRTSPHVTTTFEMDLHKIDAHRDANKAQFEKEGVRLTFTAYFIQAAIHAIKKFPEVNASIDGGDVLFKEAINIGCAVATKTGLIVPVIKNANDFSLKECAVGLSDIAMRARESKLNPSDIKGGTFSITNPGMYGSIHSQPIINQPQVAIMSIGAIIKRPVVVNQDVTIRPLCQIGLTFDHRIIDGEGGAMFLAEIRNFLESYPA